MKRVQIFSVGKLKDAQLQKLCDDYHRRCGRLFRAELRPLRDLRALKSALPKRGVLVALDERGTQSTSRQFAALLRRWLDDPGPGVSFVIGGADGLDDELRRRATHLLSLSQLTFAHRLVHLLLAEQLYRAVSILQGSPYHRD